MLGSFKFKIVMSDGTESREFTWNAKKPHDRLVQSHSWKPANVKHGDQLWIGIQFEGDPEPQRLSTITAQCKD